jgi:acyl-CoA synthetase (AMP-forming)/AMP-acid ligase II
LAAEFELVCGRFATKPAIIEGEESFSYEWLYQAALKVCRVLVARYRLPPGERVVVMLSNSPEYIAAFYGVLMAGGVVVPLPPTIESDRWRQVQESSAPALLITRDEELADREDLQDLPRQTLSLEDDRRTADCPEAADRRCGDDLAMIAYTSGSTGLPKGVMLSHRNLLANTQSILDYLPIAEDERALVVLPFCLAFGNSILQTHLLSGATLVLGGSLTFPVSIIQALRDHRATSLSGVPEVYAMLLRFAGLGDEPLPRLRYMAVAGGALKPDLAEKVARRIAPARLYLMYGQTEAAARLSYLPPEELDRRRGSIGRGIPGVQLRVVGDDGQSIAPGESGRLLARGENIMLGYWRDAAATAAVFRDGWLDTGDLGTVDDDGYIYLQGRGNLLLKVQGQRIHPREIEDVIAARFPGSQVVVVPWSCDGQTRLALFLTPPAAERITEASVRRACQTDLPRHKIPSYVEVLDRLPLNTALKVDRDALSARVAAPQRRVS